MVQIRTNIDHLSFEHRYCYKLELYCAHTHFLQIANMTSTIILYMRMFDRKMQYVDHQRVTRKTRYVFVKHRYPSGNNVKVLQKYVSPIF